LKFLFSFFKTLWGIWGAIAFALTVILFIPFYFLIFSLNIGGRKAPHIAHKITKIASFFLYTLLLIYVRTKGKEKIDKNQVYIFVSNHKSLLDIPACALSTAQTFRYLAKAELTKIPLFGYIIRKLYISVSRKDDADRRRSMETMYQSLKDGISVYIYPEGTRNKTDKPLNEFYDGAFRLALQTGYPIAVLTIRNSSKLLNGYKLQPGVIECIWDDPIIINQEKDTMASLKRKVADVLLYQLSAHQN